MNGRTEELTKWVYRGVWGVLSRWFRVPQGPPVLPVQEEERVESFRPAHGFLRYLKLQFWIWLAIIDVAILAVWVGITIANPVIGVFLAIPALIIGVVPDVIAYLAIHLRYDTTWYLMSDRSLRIRRGIWVINETTITFENVQNVSVRQGPVQRWFGIADLLVETAGGGQAQQGAHGGQTSTAHQGLVEGVADAQRIRDLILNRLRSSRWAGLGDEQVGSAATYPGWTADHLAVLRDIRDAAGALSSPRLR